MDDWKSENVKTKYESEHDLEGMEGRYSQLVS